MNTVQDRLYYFIKNHLDTSVRDFELQIGVSNGTVDKFLKKHNKNATPSDALMEKIRAKFPKFNIKWLLTGEGEVIPSSTKNAPEALEYKDQYIKQLEKEISELRGELLKTKGEMIEVYKKIVKF